MKPDTIVYLSVSVDQCTKNGEYIIATGKIVVSDESAKMEFIHQHLKSITIKELLQNNEPDTNLVDEILGILYKNKTDEADEGSWIESKDFHKVAEKIARYVASQGTLTNK